MIKGSVRKTWYGLILNWIRFWSLLFFTSIWSIFKEKIFHLLPPSYSWFSQKFTKFPEKNPRGEFLTLTFQRFKGHLCKYIAVFAWSVTWNYVYVPLNNFDWDESTIYFPQTIYSANNHISNNLLVFSLSSGERKLYILSL